MTSLILFDRKKYGKTSEALPQGCFLKNSCNGFELDFVKFPRNSNSIPKNAKLTSFKQLHFLYVISLLCLGSAGVATDVEIETKTSYM
ncbi:hypothetical protein KKA17_09460 [bacterium]|nr:hypothetical protein [bacterium]MBU1884530.1 hypothetical protein [bacterium]